MIWDEMMVMMRRMRMRVRRRRRKGRMRTTMMTMFISVMLLTCNMYEESVDPEVVRF